METLSDIVAEMRTRSREVKEAFGGRPDGVENMLDIWAERIEAIDSADAWRSLYTPGNAAATREALVWMLERMNAALHDGSFDCYETLAKIDAALSAPARNCDVYTHDKALQIWAAENEDERNGCFDEWLYHVAAERKGEGDDA